MGNFICIVEDDAEIRETLQALLELEGFEVKTAVHGQDALRYLADGTQSLPSLILLDLMMPVMDGWEFIKAVKLLPHAARIPIFVLSAVADPERLSSTPVDGFMKKPVDIDGLIRVVERYCASGNTDELRKSS